MRFFFFFFFFFFQKTCNCYFQYLCKWNDCASFGGILKIGITNVFLFNKTNQFPANKYMFKVNNKNVRKRCKICFKVTKKTPEGHVIHVVLVSGVFSPFLLPLWTYFTLSMYFFAGRAALNQTIKQLIDIIDIDKILNRLVMRLVSTFI